MTKQERIDEYKKYMSHVKRKGKETLIDWLINETDFFQSPASSKYHANYAGGLYDHSMNVLNYAKELYLTSKKLNPDFPDINAESLIICALHHDLCKVNFYGIETAWVKEGYKWIEYETYKAGAINKLPIGHGEKSVMLLLQQGFELTDDEMLAIRWHMGPYGETGIDYNLAMGKELVKLIHLADLSAGLIEPTIDYKQKAIDEYKKTL